MELWEVMPLLLFAFTCTMLMLGFPVAFTLGGSALLFSGIGMATGTFDNSYLGALPSRLYGIIRIDTLIAVPLFIFMGVMLEKTRIAEELLETMAGLFGRVRGGIGFSVVIVGMLLAASTGIVGATVVTMGLLSLPTMLQRGYSPSLAAGTICASGTLGQIIPPSIVLILLGDVLSSAYQKAQTSQGVYEVETISVGDLFAGAFLPGLMMVGLFLIYLALVAWLKPSAMPAIPQPETKPKVSTIFIALVPPVLLIIAVLGSILCGYATPTEAAAVGAIGATVLAILRRQFSVDRLKAVLDETTRVTSMVFLILIGASLFSLVFLGFYGDELVHGWLANMPGGKTGALICVMALMFFLGFFLDFIEITFVVVPIVAPVLLVMGVDPVWLGIMIAVNLQTSFLTPPFGFALFYLRGVAPATLRTSEIYKGVVPFIGIQVLTLCILWHWPALATWLPSVIFP